METHSFVKMQLSGKVFYPNILLGVSLQWAGIPSRGGMGERAEVAIFIDSKNV